MIFLDVDCLPGEDLVAAYARRGRTRRRADSLLCGPVAYLPPPPARRVRPRPARRSSRLHPGRPAPAAGDRQRGGDHRLFWSLSFALTARCGAGSAGSASEYPGYGAEDTDFAMRPRPPAIDLTWVGGAAAYHQWHPTSSPPVPHLDDILRNGRCSPSGGAGGRWRAGSTSSQPSDSSGWPTTTMDGRTVRRWRSPHMTRGPTTRRPRAGKPP